MTRFARVAGEQLATRAPFHLEATVRVLQRRPTNLVDVWDESRYVRALETSSGHVLIEVVNLGTIDAPDVRLRVLRGKASRPALKAIVRRALGLDVDPAPLQKVSNAEPRLAGVADALRGMRPPRFATLFETFASVVPFQQLSLDAGVSIVSRLVERFGDTIEQDGRRFHAFPTADVIAGARIDALKRCGLSQRKAEVLRSIARAIESGELTEAMLEGMSSSDALRFLTELPGIGPWSAALVLLRGMGRLDVFPPGDVGVVRGLTTLMRLPSKEALDRAIERFGDLRGYLYFWSLGGALLAQGLIQAAPPLRGRKQGARKSSRNR